MPDSPELAGPVDGSSFIEVGINCRHGRQIDNGRPADIFPNIGNDQDGTKKLRVRKEDYLLKSQRLQDHIDNTGIQCEETVENGTDNNPGKEVGKIGDSLTEAFKPQKPAFVDQNCQYNGQRPSENQPVKVDQDGIA